MGARPQPVILAGGAARRFGGEPKGLRQVGGERILDRLVTVCVDAFGILPLLVANDPAAPSWRPDLRVAPDRRPGTGTLGGLYTAVAEASGPVVVIAWDMPFVTAALLRYLCLALPVADAVLPASTSRRGVEPLCAAYGPGCRQPMERAIAREDYRAIAFHREVRLQIERLEVIRNFGDPDRLFFNVNTPDDLVTAESFLRQ
ncbi:MAG: molybdenum cofactor guanylyltransferase [Gemmatimonadota bacterium]